MTLLPDTKLQKKKLQDIKYELKRQTVKANVSLKYIKVNQRIRGHMALVKHLHILTMS